MCRRRVERYAAIHADTERGVADAKRRLQARHCPWSVPPHHDRGRHCGVQFAGRWPRRWTQSAGPVTITGTLEAGATAVHRLRLERGVPAFVQLASVSPTGAIGLQFVSARGVALDRDFTDNARPGVATVPSGPGSYEVEVTMTACARSTCDYVLSRHERAGGQGPLTG